MAEQALQAVIDTIQTRDKCVWLFCGDSITHGALHTHGLRDYVELVEERVRYELGKSLHIFVNSAISGNTTREIKSQLDHRVIRFQPDVVSLMVGMNDAARMEVKEYDANLREIVRRVKSETPATILLQTCCAIHPDKAPERKTYPVVMDAMRQVAHDTQTALIDHQSHWENTRVENRPLYDSWMSDAIHPNALGHWIFADRILADLGLGPLENCEPPMTRR